MNDRLHVDNLILGAGLSGISFAYFLNSDNYLILEKDSTPGGYCRTIKNPNYVWDYAGHFYHFKTEKYKKLFESLVEPEQIIHQVKNTKIYFKGRKIDYPFQMNIHQLPQDDFISCLYDLFTKDENIKQTDFLEMLYAKFGKSITEKFLRPYNEKLYATDLHNLDKDAMGRFFPYADKDAIIRNMKESQNSSYNDTFMYLKKGTGYFIDKLFAKIDENKVLFNTSAVSIDPVKKEVKTSDGKIISYNNLINTMPFNQLLKLLNQESTTELSDQLSYNKVLVLNLGFDKPSPKFTEEHWVYFPDKNLNFYRVGFYNNILRQKNLSIYVEIGFSKTGTYDIEKELEKAIAGLTEVGIIDPSMNLVDSNILIMDPAYVHIAEKTNHAVQEQLENFENDHIYNLGRYGRWTYNSMEDCMELADRLTEKLRSK